MQASGHFSYPHKNSQPVLAPVSRATGTGNCCLHGFPVDTAGHHPDHPHWVPRHQHPWCRAVGYPPKGGQASGHSGYPHKTFVKQLDAPAVRTRALRKLDTPTPYIRHMDNKVRTRSLSNWTLPGSPQPKLRLTLVISTKVPKHRPRTMDDSILTSVS